MLRLCLSGYTLVSDAFPNLFSHCSPPISKVPALGRRTPFSNVIELTPLSNMIELTSFSNVIELVFTLSATSSRLLSALPSALARGLATIEVEPAQATASVCRLFVSTHSGHT